MTPTEMMAEAKRLMLQSPDSFVVLLAHDLAVELEKEGGLSRAFEVAARNSSEANKALRERVEELEGKVKDSADYYANLATSAYCEQGHRIELMAQSGLKMFAEGLTHD